MSRPSLKPLPASPTTGGKTHFLPESI